MLTIASDALDGFGSRVLFRCLDHLGSFRPLQALTKGQPQTPKRLRERPMWRGGERTQPLPRTVAIQSLSLQPSGLQP